ncbi:MAG: HAMP domain-containing protein [Anaerolineae bacterium]|nr:HAMP domain-containing protein [Anaerolineae bacterium]
MERSAARRWLWSASPLRAVIEGWLISTILLLLLLTDSHQPLLVRFSTVWVMLFGVMVSAFRCRMPAQPLVRALLYDFGVAVLLMVGMISIFYFAPTLPLTDQQIPITLVEFGLVFGSADILAYMTLRLPMRLWALWEVARKRHLRWSIVHAQLMTLLVLLAVFVVWQAVEFSRNLSIGEQPLEITSPAGVLLSVTLMLIFAVVVIVISLPVIVGLMALGAVLSYTISRRTTRRIEALATATSSVRNGAYDTRVEVDGEDEIAQLQQDFNAMTAELEHTLAALKTERDTVTGLLQTRRELIASVSHELRTPLASIRGYLDSTLEHWQNTPPPTLRHDLTVIEQEAIRVQRLVDDLFTLSRAEVGRLTLRCVPTELVSILRRIVDTGAPLAWQQRRVKLSIETPPQLAAVVDETRLEQVLWNLVHNALRHTAPGGIVVIAARATDARAQIDVRDTGDGIPPDELAHVWERFYRGDRSDGAGLGLALVKELTEAMDGTVAVSSEPGKGSVFSVAFPTV